MTAQTSTGRGGRWPALHAKRKGKRRILPASSMGQCLCALPLSSLGNLEGILVCAQGTRLPLDVGGVVAELYRKCLFALA
jgi:hypothetical protein